MAERNVHIVLYSAFPSISGGRENWVNNIAHQMRGVFRKVFVYSFRSDQPIYYDLSDCVDIELVQVESLQHTVNWRNNPWSRLLNKLLTFVDFMYMFPRRVAREMSERVQDDDIVLAMNPIIESAAARRLRLKYRSRFHLYCSVRGLVAEELTTWTRVPQLRPLFQALEAKALKQADRILANGEDTKDYLSRIGFACVVIPNGVDVTRFASPDLSDSALHPLIDLKHNNFKIICALGSLREIKGINELIKCIPQFKALCKAKCKFVLVGNGNPTPFRDLALQLDVMDELFFYGQCHNVPGVLALTDCAACVSYGGGMSMAALECMAASKPIVAWDSAVYRSFLDHDQTALLVPQMDYRHLARALAHLIDHPGKATALGRAAREASQQYDWPKVAERLFSQMSPTLIRSGMQLR